MAGFLTSVIEEFITGKGTLQQIGLLTPQPSPLRLSAGLLWRPHSLRHSPHHLQSDQQGDDGQVRPNISTIPSSLLIASWLMSQQSWSG